MQNTNGFSLFFVRDHFAPEPSVLLSLSFSSCTEDVLIYGQNPCAAARHTQTSSCLNAPTTCSCCLFLCFFFLWDFSFVSVFIARALLVVGASSCAYSTCSLTTSTVWSSGSAPGPVSYHLFCSLHARGMFYWPIPLCCRTGTQHHVVLTSDHYSFLLPISVIFFLWYFSFELAVVARALLVAS